jgi:putative membrane protein
MASTPIIATLLKGMAMGAADVVPGVSGGTIAFITGIYERLLAALKSFTPAALLVLKREGWRPFWAYVDATFLCALFGGILLSIATLAHGIEFALAEYPLQVWGFFSGLILASTIYIGRQLHWRALVVLVAFCVGALAAIWLGSVKPINMPINTLTIFAAGATAICAMILPGISGSFLLLIMGVYPVIIAAVTEFNLKLLLTFMGGCVVGLLLFSHLLHWLLQRCRQPTLAFLCGVLAGSLSIVWPWKHAVATVVDRHGETVPLVQRNLMPWDYESITGVSSAWPGVLTLFVVAVVMVFALEYGARRLQLKRAANAA